FPRSWARRLSPQSVRPSPPCAEISSRRWSMSKDLDLPDSPSKLGGELGNTTACRRSSALLALLFVAFQSDPRQIVEEAQKRTTSQSQRYEGTLQVVDAKSK